MPAVVGVEGLREVDRAFGQIDKALQKELRAELKKAAEPARAEAERLAGEKIRNITPRWSRVKLGATARGAYIAPASRRSVGRPRPNLGELLVERALLPGAEAKEDQTRRHVEGWLDDLERRAGF